MKLENKHNIRLRLVLDNRVNKNSRTSGEKFPRFSLAIGLKWEGQREKLSIAKVSKSLKFTKHVFNNEYDLIKSQLKTFDNVLIEYNKVVNSMEVWDYNIFQVKIKEEFREEGPKNKASITKLFQDKMRALDNRRAGSSGTYKTTMNSLISFHGSMPSFLDISSDFLQLWQNWYMQTARSGGGFSKNVSNLRAIFNIRPRDERDCDPFGAKLGVKNSYVAPPSISNKFVIPDHVMDAIQHANLQTEKQRYYRDLFMLSYNLAGMNLVDIFALRWDQYDVFRHTITWNRRKSMYKKNPIDITVKVSQEAADIIKRHASPRTTDGLIFPEMEGLSQVRGDDRKHSINVQINIVVKAIAKKIKFEEWDKVTFYRARHTFATNVRDQGVSYMEIKDLLGHQSMSMTNDYLGALTEESLDRLKDFMDNRFKKKD